MHTPGSNTYICTQPAWRHRPSQTSHVLRLDRSSRRGSSALVTRRCVPASGRLLCIISPQVCGLRFMHDPCAVRRFCFGLWLASSHQAHGDGGTLTPCCLSAIYLYSMPKSLPPSCCGCGSAPLSAALRNPVVCALRTLRTCCPAPPNLSATMPQAAGRIPHTTSAPPPREIMERRACDGIDIYLVAIAAGIAPVEKRGLPIDPTLSSYPPPPTRPLLPLPTLIPPLGFLLLLLLLLLLPGADKYTTPPPLCLLVSCRPSSPLP